MKNKIALSSLAMDLHRVAMGYHRGSNKMADRFFIEAMKRKNEIDVSSVKPYIRQLLKKLETIEQAKPHQYSEEILTYSILLQNAAVNS